MKANRFAQSDRGATARFLRPLVSRTLVAALAVAGVLCVSVTSADAQEQQQRRRRGAPRVDQQLLKNSPNVLKAVGDVAGVAARSTVRFVVNGQPAVLGTVVRDDGVVLTKASELDAGFIVELPDGRQVAGTILGVMKEHDLAAVKVEATGLTAAEFSLDGVNEGYAGSWLFTPGVGQEGVLSAGNLSVSGLRKIAGSGALLGVGLGEPQAGVPVVDVTPGGAAEAAGLRAGDLIVGVNGVPIGRMREFTRALRNGPADASYALLVSREGARAEIVVTLAGGQLGVTLATEAAGVPVTQVSPGSAAESAGMKAGDIVLAIDDRVVRDRDTLVRQIMAYKPGAVVDVTYLRNGEEATTTATLGYRSSRSPRGDFQNSMGTRLSGRAVDFPAVLQHDSILNADQMGGPVVDLHGRVLGMNIARAGRVETYALPAQVLQAAIPQLLSGKLPTTTGPAAPADGRPLPQGPLGDDGGP